MGIIFKKGNTSVNAHIFDGKPLSDAIPGVTPWIKIVDGDVPVRRGNLLSDESIVMDGDEIVFITKQEADKRFAKTERR
jgi:hypothetical protein